MNSVAAHIDVTGRVQGVGFRWYCLQHARRLGLTGWVKNNPDGSVTSYVEGDRGAIEAYIDQLKLGPGSAHVANLNIDWRQFTGKFKSFEVTR